MHSCLGITLIIFVLKACCGLLCRSTFDYLVVNLHTAIALKRALSPPLSLISVVVLVDAPPSERELLLIILHYVF